MSRTEEVTPTAAITLTPALSAAWATAPVVSWPSSQTEIDVPVTSAAGLLGTTYDVDLTFTVTSADPDFSGLLLGGVDVTVTPPAILSQIQGPTRVAPALTSAPVGSNELTVTVAYLPVGATVTGIAFGPGAASVSGTFPTLSVTTPESTPFTTQVTVPVTLTYLLSGGGTLEVTMADAYTFVPYPGVSVTKAAFADAGLTEPIPDGATVTDGATVYWSYTVTNTGDTPLESITVTDDILGAVCTPATIALAGSVTCTASGVVE